ncbi:MAG TPA: FAD-dependent oxidoreductase [Gemmatimonadaceae bacterium]|nr:FAD-dependent oxidoreductase [Gemmatimonadaceae bacterium]
MSDARASAHVLVIGGGFSGVAAAAALHARGHVVTLLERHAALGGRARSDARSEGPVDTGAQLIASSFTHTMRLLATARLEATNARDVFVRDGKRLPIRFGSIASMLRFGGLGPGDKLKLGTTLLPLLARHAGSLRADDNDGLEALDGVSARSFVQQAISERAANVLVEPPLNAFYGARGRETSLAFFLTLGRYGSDASLLASRDGWSNVLATAAAGVRLELNAHVDVIQVTPTGVVARDRTHREWQADAIVIATSAAVAHALLGPVVGETHALVSWLASVVTRPTWTVMLTLARPMHAETFGVLADPSEATMVSACALPAGRWSAEERSAGIVLAWPTPDAVERLANHPATEIVTAMMPEIERLVPETRAAVERARVFRFDEGTPLAEPGFLAHRAMGRQLEELLPLPVALAGDYLTMPLVEGAVVSGERAAGRIARILARA